MTTPIPPIPLHNVAAATIFAGMLTRHQRKAMLFIEKEMERTGGVAPSVRELANHFRYRSRTAARCLLKSLEARGHIRRIVGRDRAIEVLRPVGRVAFYKFDDREKILQPMSRLGSASHKI
jgi:SOS-response transcriptional repressor LexA